MTKISDITPSSPREVRMVFAGLMLTLMTGGVVLASFIGGRLVTCTGKYKILAVAGLAAATFAFFAVMRTTIKQKEFGKTFRDFGSTWSFSLMARYPV